MESVLRYLDWATVGLALLGGLVSLLLLEIFGLNSSRGRIPPGPTPLPFVGNLHQLMRNPMAYIRAMPRYGEICSFYLGRKPTIVLNSVQLVKEAFVQNGAASSGRPAAPIECWITKQNGIIMATYGNTWRQQRRFALHTLRDFGLGKKTLEERVAEEARHLIKEMLKHEGESFNPIHPFMNAVSNIICSIIFGDRFEYDDKRFARLLHILNENFRLAGSAVTQILNVIPIIRYIPGPHHTIFRNADSLKEFILEIVEEHRKTLDPENIRDFIDAYLVEMSKVTSKTVGEAFQFQFNRITEESKEDDEFDDENLIKSTADLFIAGTDTTATTLRWGLIYMMNHPDVQERCHEEVIRVLGFDRSPCMDDRTKLPYTYATVHEIQRCANIVPLGVMHQTTQSMQLRGYHLPVGTVIIPNLTAIMTDSEHWNHPDSFNPENFLDDKGQFCKNNSFLPFSLGPRMCLGETLAKTELFIFFTSLIQRLHFSWPPGAQHPDMDGIISTVRSPLPFNTVCCSRENTH